MNFLIIGFDYLSKKFEKIFSKILLEYKFIKDVFRNSVPVKKVLFFLDCHNLFYLILISILQI